MQVHVPVLTILTSTLFAEVPGPKRWSLGFRVQGVLACKPAAKGFKRFGFTGSQLQKLSIKYDEPQPHPRAFGALGSCR